MMRRITLKMDEAVSCGGCSYIGGKAQLFVNGELVDELELAELYGFEAEEAPEPETITIASLRTFKSLKNEG